MTSATRNDQIVDIFYGQKGILIYDPVGPVIRTIIAHVVATPASLDAGLATID